MNTHVESQLLAAYAGGQVDVAHACSVEAHVIECADCQAAIGRLVEPARTQRVWADLEDRLDAQRAGPVQAVLGRLGVSEHLARLIAATPSLSMRWLGGAALALGVAVIAAHASEQGLLLFLCIAALLPLAGVAAAFGRGLNPAFEIAGAARLSGARLLLRRTAAVVPTTIGLAGLASLTLPSAGWTAAAWLLPALGLVVMSLALATYVTPVCAFGAVAVAWLSIVVLSAYDSGDRLAAFAGGSQIASAAVAVGATVILALRLDHLDLGQRSL